MNFRLPDFSILLIVCCFMACNDPSVIGAELVDDNQVNVEFQDDIPFNIQTVSGDTLNVYAEGQRLSSFLLGNFVDPIFGKTQASVYSQVLFTSAPDFTTPNLEVDSAVLVLPYFLNGVYGDTLSPVSFEVFQLEEPLAFDGYYNTNSVFKADRKISQDNEFFPTPNISYNYFTIPRNGSGTLDSASTTSIRIPLTQEFGNFLLSLQDTAIYDNLESFVNTLNGIYVRPQGEAPSMLSFDFNSTSGGIELYYDTISSGADIDTTSLVYRFPFTSTSVKVVNFEHDYSGAPIESFIDNDIGAEQAFLQGMEGVNVKVVFPDLSAFQSENGEAVAINLAELELPIATRTDDNTAIFTEAAQIIAYTRTIDPVTNDTAEYTIVSDISLALAAFSNLQNAFGGNVEVVNGIEQYNLNITEHFQRMINGEATNELLLIATPTGNAVRIGLDQNTQVFSINQSNKAERAARTILATENNPITPAKLRVAFTKL